MKLSHPRSRGQGLAEFALVLPILLMMILGILDLGRVFFSYAMLSNSLRTALRNAEVYGYSSSNQNYLNCKLMRDTINKTFFIDPSTTTITIQYYNATTKVTNTCPSNVDTVTSFSVSSDDLLQITVATSVKLMTPFLAQIIPAMKLNFYGQRTIVTTIGLTGTDCTLTPTNNTSSCDQDYDGLPDLWEIQNFCPALETGFTTTDPSSPAVLACLASHSGLMDEETTPKPDGCNNGCEYTNGTDPNAYDTDRDGLSDGEEVYTYKTDPTNPDTDGDGAMDGAEVTAGGDPLTVPSLSIDNVTVNETDGSATFTVTLSNPTGVLNTYVDYATAPGTATSPDDYTPTGGTLDFPPGLTGTSISQTITVPVIADADSPESAETFDVNLSNVRTDSTLSTSTVNVTSSSGSCIIAAN